MEQIFFFFNNDYCLFQLIVIICPKYYKPDKERFITLPIMPGHPIQSTAVGW